MNDFTLLDTVGALRAMAGFAAILFAPGYVLGFALDIFGFRRRSLLERIAWAMSISFAVSPVVTALLGRVMPLGGVAVMFAVVALATLVLLIIDHASLTVPVNKYTVSLGLFLLLGIVVVIGELVDYQSGPRLYLSVTVADQAYRVAFINAIAHTGIPPQNPLYHPGAGAPLRYYYFWYAVSAACMKLAGVSARQALIASSAWTGIAVTAMVALFARHFLVIRERLQRFILIASLLLCVTGLDILPVFYNLFVNHDFGGDLEWWSGDQITSWLDSILWVPHHTSAMICCLTAFLLLWRTREAAARRHKIAAVVLSGCAAASSFGLSVYVAAGFAIVMAGWSVRLLAKDETRRLVVRSCCAGAIAALLSVPFLREMLHTHSGTDAGVSAGPSHLLTFGVRGMIDPNLVTQLPALSHFRQAHPIVLDQLVRLVLLLPGYALELGAFGMILVLGILARKRMNEVHRTAVGLALGGLILVAFVRSSVIGNNDFGYRAALFPCFFLLLLLAENLTNPAPKNQRAALTLMILVGLAGTAFQALMLRVDVPLHVSANMPEFVGLPEAAFAARRGYAAADGLIPPQAIVQANLGDPGDYFTQLHMLYSQRGMVADASVDCGAVFGGDPARCHPAEQAIRALYLLPAPPASEAVGFCRAMGADYLAASRHDPAWSDPHSWIWTLPAVGDGTVAGESLAADRTLSFRVVKCGTLQNSMP